jgi:hypothetical protein
MANSEAKQDSTAATTDSSGAAESASDAAAQEAMRISQMELRARSHDLELLISLASILALLSVPSVVMDWAALHFAGLEPWLARAALFAIIFICALSYALAFMFGVHVLLRAVWIAVIGLDTHFPLTSDWRKVSFLGPIGFAAHRENIVQRSVQINQLDRLCTTVFVLGITMISMVAIGALAGLSTVFLIQAAETFAPRFSGAITILIAVAVAMFLIGNLAAATVDRHYGKKNEMPPAWMATWIRKFVRSQYRGAIGTINGLMQPMLADRIGMRGYYVVLVLFAALLIMVGNQMVTVFNGTSFTPPVELALERGRVMQSYVESDEHDQMFMTHQPQVETLISRESVIQLNLPFVWTRDHDSLLKLCGANYRAELLACGQKYFRLTRNGAEISDAIWLLSANRQRRSMSLDVLITLPEAGLHRLMIDRQRQNTDSRLLFRARRQSSSKTHIPIYYLPER